MSAGLPLGGAEWNEGYTKENSTNIRNGTFGSDEDAKKDTWT